MKLGPRLPSEKISTAQLVLFLDAVRRGEGEPEETNEDQLVPGEIDDADQRLRGHGRPAPARAPAVPPVTRKRDDGVAALLPALERIQSDICRRYRPRRHVSVVPNRSITERVRRARHRNVRARFPSSQ